MKACRIAALVGLGLLATGCATQPESSPEIKLAEANCKRWAALNNVPANEMNTYMRFCILEQTVPDKPDAGGGD